MATVSVASPTKSAASKQHGAASAAAVPHQNTLRDVVVDEMLRGRQHKLRPIVSQLALAGEIIAKDDPKALFESLVDDTRAASHSADPLNGKLDPESDETVLLAGAFVEMPNHFFAIFESEPQYLLNLAVELKKRLATDKRYSGFRSVHVVFYTDDVGLRSFKQFSAFDGLTSAGAGNKTRRLEDQIVEVVHGMVALGRAAPATSMKTPQARDFFANAKSSHTLPKPGFVDLCINCGLLLNLDEYCEVYANVPDVVRPSEVVYPVEPPLKYEP